MRRAQLVWVGIAALLVACASATKPAATSGAIAQNDIADAGADTDGDLDDDDDDDGGAAGETTIVTEEPAGPCPTEMVLVESDGVRVCIDRWEASLVEIDGDGNEKPFPHWMSVDGHTVRAVSAPDVFPQGYISELQAEDACAASKKRLCSENEWMTTCTGPEKTTFPYGTSRRPTTCHDSGKSAIGVVFGQQALASPPPPPPASKGKPAHKTEKKAASTTKKRPTRGGTKPAATTPSRKKGGKPAKASARPSSVDPWVWQQLNDPRLGQVDGALAKTGSHEDCTNSFGAFDMMGNIHEWVRTPATAPHGTFCGGYYLDTSINGDGCKYRTRAHAHEYHDYSTGFRCCADPH